jgi:hypothetical protein
MQKTVNSWNARSMFLADTMKPADKPVSVDSPTTTTKKLYLPDGTCQLQQAVLGEIIPEKEVDCDQFQTTFSVVATIGDGTVLTVENITINKL